MTDTTSPARPAPPAPATADPALVERLAAHRALVGVPRTELEWLAAHGTLEHYAKGFQITRRGQPINTGAVFIFSGRISHFLERGGVWRRVMEWQAGDVTGQLPYSRMSIANGNTIFDEDSEGLVIGADLIPQLPVSCPTVTASLVHIMVDRARAFKASDSQVEKMASLGKLAAGLAHELNNPAAAAARSASALAEAVAVSDRASRALGAAKLSDTESAVLDELHRRCIDVPTTAVLSPLERADREDELADWLAAHDADESHSGPLASTGVTTASLDALAAALPPAKLDAALQWIAAGCTIRGLARDIDRAATRVHDLVSAVKGFTYMDHATTPEPVDLRRGITDTISVLGAKARSRSIALTVDVPEGLPPIRGFGGEMNQVWANLIDNAIDAVGEAGRVIVSARVEGSGVVVRVEDNGPGIPAELRTRIFDPFFTTKPVGSGTGLGLDIVRRLVENNDGQIGLESAPGRTVFSVILRPA